MILGNVTALIAWSICAKVWMVVMWLWFRKEMGGRNEQLVSEMKGEYIPFNDGNGIVDYHYKCPKCGHITRFSDCEQGCEVCDFSEPYVDPDDWMEARGK